jgi:hypothetical protein
MPSTIFAKGTNFWSSSGRLSARLMKTSVERVSGSDFAKARVPRRFFSLNGSSGMTPFVVDVEIPVDAELGDEAF